MAPISWYDLQRNCTCQTTFALSYHFDGRETFTNPQPVLLPQEVFIILIPSTPPKGKLIRLQQTSTGACITFYSASIDHDFLLGRPLVLSSVAVEYQTTGNSWFNAMRIAQLKPNQCKIKISALTS